MNARRNSQISQATTLALALTEAYPDSAYGAVPASEQQDALEAYLAYDEGAFDEAPQALDTYLAHQRNVV